MAIPFEQQAASRPSRVRQWWSVVTVLLVLAVFAQAVFAGAMLSGVDWARIAHRANGGALIVSSLAAGLVAVATLRRIPSGLRLGSSLLALAALLFVQFALGRMAATGANLMWVHVPLGVALLWLAGQAASAARKLGGSL